MDEVPRPQPALVLLDQDQALAVEDEKVLLLVLGVVHRVRLPRLEDVDVDPELGKPVLAAFERNPRAEVVAAERLRVGDVDDEPVRVGQR
jgi:hypothetical protein